MEGRLPAYLAIPEPSGSPVDNTRLDPEVVGEDTGAKEGVISAPRWPLPTYPTGFTQLGTLAFLSKDERRPIVSPAIVLPGNTIS